MKSTLIIALGACMFLMCAREYNPFADAQNARVVIASTHIAQNDTLDIFSTKTLACAILVKELVDSIRFTCSGNRFWPTGDSLFTPQDFTTASIHLVLSLKDTGLQHLITTVYRTNTTLTRDTLHLYGKQILQPDTVFGYFADTILLKTVPVADQGESLRYHWLFGAGTEVVTPACSTKTVLLNAAPAGIGELWVSSGLQRSPSVPFYFVMQDTTPPVIWCENDSLRNDTIFTSDTNFIFKAHIIDRGSLPAEVAQVNSSDFDLIEGASFYKVFPSMHLHPPSKPLHIQVLATDNTLYGNSDTASFMAIFIGNSRPTAKLRITIPTRPALSLDSFAYIVASCEATNLPDSGLTIVVRKELDTVTTPRTITTALSTPSWHLLLDTAQNGRNRFRITVYNKQTRDSLASDTITLTYSPASIDLAVPKIDQILLNGKPAQGQFTPLARVPIAIHAYDENSGLASLSIQGIVRTVSDTTTWFYDTVTLQHSPTGNAIIISAVDKKGNLASKSVSIFRNRQPVLYDIPQSVNILYKTAWLDTLNAFDPDNDSLSYQIIKQPIGFTRSSSGVLSWTPGYHLGNHQVIIRVFDGYEPLDVSFTLNVYDTASGPPPDVKLLTRETAFPSFIHASVDTLRVMLKTVTATGVPPFKFTAKIQELKRTILNASLDSTILYAPQLQDTGVLHFVVYVKDALGRGDTLYPQVTVLPPNQPCSLSVKWNNKFLPNDTLINLSLYNGLAMLRYTISDPDNPLYERHAVTIRQSRSGMISTIDSAAADSFSVAIDPYRVIGLDTITVIVKDRANTADTLKIRINYGNILRTQAFNATVPEVLKYAQGSFFLPLSGRRGGWGVRSYFS